MNNIKTYSELIKFDTFEERLSYLQLEGTVGFDTFGFDRYINQQFYRSKEWKEIRNLVIVRDKGCDLGVEGFEIFDKVFVHHMNPLRVKDIEASTIYLMNPEYLITVSLKTHNLIHYGEKYEPPKMMIERSPNDMCPWKL